MKISEQTLKVLKNFASINSSILIRAGSVLSTISESEGILAEAGIEEEFPIEFALYDLVEFLNTLKLFSSPVLDFRSASDACMYICEEDNVDFRVRYIFGKKDRIKFPERRPLMDNIDVSFVLDTDTLESIRKASSVLQLPYVVVTPNSANGVNIEVTSIKNPSANNFSIGLDGDYDTGVDFKFIFEMDSFKMLSSTYNVHVSGKKVSYFESDAIDYYIGLHPISHFQREV